MGFGSWWDKNVADPIEKTVDAVVGGPYRKDG